MEFDKIVIVPKMSKYELDMHNYKLNHDALISKYQKEGVDFRKILDSHNRQQGNLKLLLHEFPDAIVLSREQMTLKYAEEADLVIAFGGDNHFQYISHYMNEKPILGVNSDPILSEGVATYISGESVIGLKNKLGNKSYDIELWTRLEVTINGKKLPTLVTGEAFVGESLRKEMSRHILEFNNKKEEQKSSGIIISTGFGSTGWYDSAIRFIHPEGKVIDKTESKGLFVVSEPYHGRLNGYSLVEGELLPDNEIIIHSLNDNDGKVIIDSFEEYKFSRGDVIKIKIAKMSLKVIRPN